MPPVKDTGEPFPSEIGKATAEVCDVAARPIWGVIFGTIEAVLQDLQVYALRILALAASFLLVSIGFFAVSELSAKAAVGVGVLAAIEIAWLFKAKRRAESSDFGRALNQIRREDRGPK